MIRNNFIISFNIYPYNKLNYVTKLLQIVDLNNHLKIKMNIIVKALKSFIIFVSKR